MHKRAADRVWGTIEKRAFSLCASWAQLNSLRKETEVFHCLEPSLCLPMLPETYEYLVFSFLRTVAKVDTWNAETLPCRPGCQGVVKDVIYDHKVCHIQDMS